MNTQEIFHEFSVHPHYSRYESLLGSNAPHQEVFSAVYDRIASDLPGLLDGARYTTEQLCGPVIWKKWASKGQHRAIGVALSFLVANGFLPLAYANRPDATNKLYGLKPVTLRLMRVPVQSFSPGAQLPSNLAHAVSTCHQAGQA